MGLRGNTTFDFQIKKRTKTLLSGGHVRRILCAAILLAVPLMSSCLDESVHTELLRLQNSRGYRLVSVRDDRISTLSFADRTLSKSKMLIDKATVINGTVSPDGTRVAVSFCPAPGFTHPRPNVSECPGGIHMATVRPDGSDLQEHRELRNPGTGFCWSHDMSKLVLSADDTRQSDRAPDSLQILDLKSGATEVVADGPDAFVNSQCWSPDDQQLAYTINQPMGIRTVRLYDAKAKKSRDLADGGLATWSPDGKWIAFLRCPPSLQGCSYHGVQTSTGDEKLFFKADGVTALSWSPDSHFVAYVSGASASERTPAQQEREMVRLRVRRLEDDSEYTCADFFDGDIMWFDWVS